MTEEAPKPKIVRPAWSKLAPDEYDDSLFWADRDPLPMDIDATTRRRSKKAGLVGVLALSLLLAQREHPHLAQAVACGNVDDIDTRVARLPLGVDFGQHNQHPGYRFLAVELIPRPFWVSPGLWTPGHRFIVPASTFGGTVEGIKIFGVEDKDFLQETQPAIPIIERPLRH